MICALDIATTTGVAVGEIGGRPKWAVRTFPSGEAGTGQVVSMFRAWLGEMCTRYRPVMLVFESPYIPHAGGFMPINPTTLRRLIAMVETASSVAFERNIRCYEAPGSQATKYLTGKARWGVKGDKSDVARARKKAAVIAACLRHGWDVEGSDDAADALALWALAEDIVAPAAADRRRREAADRERLTAGEGPLFRPTSKGNGPPAVTGEPLLSTSDEGNSSNAAGPKNKHRGRTIQSGPGELPRKSA